MRIAKCISHIMEVSGTTELEIGQKPTTVEEYESWKNKLVDISFIATDKMFKEFERCGLVNKKTNLMNVTVNSILSMYAKYKKRPKKDMTDV